MLSPQILRRLVGLLLLAFAFGGGWVGFRLWHENAARVPAPKPAPLPLNLSSNAKEFIYTWNSGEKTVAEIRASNFREVKNPPVMELEKVEVRLYREDAPGGQRLYDLIRSPQATFTGKEGLFRTEGEVELTRGLPAEGEAKGRLLKIITQGASYDMRSGVVSTTGNARFWFGQGEGSAVGAVYNPATAELQLNSGVDLLWKATDPNRPNLHIQAGTLLWLEKDSRVRLGPWSKLERGALTLNAANAEIQLIDGIARVVDAVDAVGVDREAGRQLDYKAKNLGMRFTELGAAESIIAENEAQLVSTTEATRTTTNAQRIELTFAPAEGESMLQRAQARGDASVESTPLPRKGATLPETRILRSPGIDLAMQANGQQIANIETTEAGTLDFLPNAPQQRRRHIDAQQFWFTCAEKNILESVRAVQVKTRSEPAAATKNGAPAITASKEMLARFQPTSGELLTLQQSGDFTYEEGTRRARSDSALLEQKANTILLSKTARVNDPTGSTDADEILLNQGNGDFSAQGRVRSTRSNGGETTQATADRMNTIRRNTFIRYEGNALLWRTSNRLSADRIDIDTQKAEIRGEGKVVNQIQDQKSPELTTVRARQMLYNDKERYADYDGDVLLVRPGLNTKSTHLRAYLTEKPAGNDTDLPDNGVDRVFATGKVEILENFKALTRKGLGERAEYYLTDGRLFLEGGNPELYEFENGLQKTVTRGPRLSWLQFSDKLIVDAPPTEKAPTSTRLRRKR
jgi:lipopolysaccharide export system protein LptA